MEVGWKASFSGGEKVEEMRKQGTGGVVSLDVGLPVNYDRENGEDTEILELESSRRGRG